MILKIIIDRYINIHSYKDKIVIKKEEKKFEYTRTNVINSKITKMSFYSSYI